MFFVKRYFLPPMKTDFGGFLIFIVILNVVKNILPTSFLMCTINDAKHIQKGGGCYSIGTDPSLPSG